MKKVSMYTDGARKGTGRGGWGVLFIHEDGEFVEMSGSEPNTTNNRMELMAAIAGLEALTESHFVELYSDSQYLINCFNHGWYIKWMKNGWKTSARGSKPVKNRDLWMRLFESVRKHKVKFVWVRGHSDNESNRLCRTTSLSAEMLNSFSLITVLQMD